MRERYFASYAGAIAAIGAAAGTAALPSRPGISIKLSALCPRYEPLSRPRVLAELVPRSLELAISARAHDLNFTIDAEEADRLELSLDIFAALAAAPALAGWHGLGLAVQAYQKRAADVIDYVSRSRRHHDRRFTVRLVKGAYWDTEMKRAQERGLADYPVFTRKAMTDLNYVACAQKLLAARPRLFPQFATHNALTVAMALAAAGSTAGFEFQRLHGMGEKLYEALLSEAPAPRLPRLRAGRPASRPARLSGAPTARERRQFVFRGARCRRRRSSVAPPHAAAATDRNPATGPPQGRAFAG